MTAITRNLPSFIKDPAVSLIGPHCYVSLIENLHVSDVDCLKLAISKGLGIAIILGGTVMKVPQLLLIIRAKHARGLSLPAFVLETLAYLITLIYAYRNEYPFSTYGENLFLTIQNIAITLLIIHYTPTHLSLTTKPTKSQLQSNSPRVFIAGLLFFLATYALLYVPMSSLQLLQLGTVPISLFSKIPQMSENFKNKSTGQLSVFAVASQVLGCAARLFTTATEMGDSLVFAGFALAFLLNLMLGVQIWMYWGRGVPSKEHYPKEKEWISEKSDAVLDMPHQHHRQHDQPSFIPVDVPAQTISTSTSTGTTSGGRRWARKVD